MVGLVHRSKHIDRPFEIGTSKSLVFKCFWYSDAHCIAFPVYVKLTISMLSNNPAWWISVELIKIGEVSKVVG